MPGTGLTLREYVKKEFNKLDESIAIFLFKEIIVAYQFYLGTSFEKPDVIKDFSIDNIFWSDEQIRVFDAGVNTMSQILDPKNLTVEFYDSLQNKKK